MPIIKLHSISYTKAELLGVPEKERTFFLVMTSLANDIQTLNKQMIMAMKTFDENKIVEQGCHAVAMLNLRMLAGRLYEGWKSLSEHYPALATEYENHLGENARKGFSSLSSYFSPESNDGSTKPKRALLAMVRDKIGFHSDFKIASKGFDSVADETEMGEYICQSIGNTLYFSTEMVHMQVLNKFCGEQHDQIESLGILLDQARDVTRWLNEFVFGFAKVFLSRHFQSKLNEARKNGEELDNLPAINDLKLPYFMILK